MLNQRRCGALVLAGCGAGEPAEGSHSDAELVVMSTYTPSDAGGPFFAKALEGYTAKTGIPVRSITSSAVDIFSAYETSVLAGEEPDVLLANLYDKSLTWTANDATVPVNDYITKWGLTDRFKPEALKDWTDGEGRLAAFPYGGFSWPVWFNKAVLAKAGVTEIPTTTEQLIAAAGRLKAAGIIPVAIGGSDYGGEKFLLQYIQTRMTPDEAKSVLGSGGYCASPSARAGIDGFLALKDGGVFPDNAEGLTSDNMTTSFYSGQAAMMISGSWAFSSTPPEIASDVTLGGFPIPAGSTFTKPVAYQAYSATGIWLTKNSRKRIDDVRAFVDYITSPEVIGTQVADAGIVPTVQVPDLNALAGRQPLLLSALTEVPQKVDFAVFPDLFVPGKQTQKLITATAGAFAPGATTDSVCSALDAAYARKGSSS